MEGCREGRGGEKNDGADFFLPAPMDFTGAHYSFLLQ